MPVVYSCQDMCGMSFVLYLDTEKVSQKVAKKRFDPLSICHALMNAVFAAPTKHPPISISLPVSTSVDALLMSVVCVNGQMLLNSFLWISYSVGIAFNRVHMKHWARVCHNCFVLRCEISLIYYLPEYLPGTDKIVPLQQNAVMQCLAAILPKIVKARSSKTSSQSNVWCYLEEMDS